MSNTRRAALAKLNITSHDDRPPRRHRKGRKGRKPRKPRHNKRGQAVLVKCCLCGKDVKGKETLEISIGRACKCHPGVQA